MILPIYAYGFPVLKRVAQDIPEGSDLGSLVEDMYQTMYAASGVGLAGPQVGKSLRIFVVDAEPMDQENLKGFKRAFINPVKIEETGQTTAYQEGCLSIPNIHEDVSRPDTLRLRYFDEHWQPHEETFTGMAARVIQHEYDHIEGILFTDHLSPLRRRLLQGRLAKISRGQVKITYRMKFPEKK
ncbi:MAG: peptide deformylase [Bernardetiaceae bacterium]